MFKVAELEHRLKKLEKGVKVLDTSLMKFYKTVNDLERKIDQYFSYTEPKNRRRPGLV